MPETMKAGRELDAEIAVRVMGWDTDGTRLWPPYTKRSKWKYGISAPAYSTSIASAWEVVEKMTERAFTGFSITVSRSEHFVGAHAVFMPVTRASSEAELRYGPQLVEAHADTAPLAICLAALAAIGKEEG